MQQYFVGRNNMSVSDIDTEINTHVENVIFSNERVDSAWNKSHLRITNSTFAKMGFKTSTFKQCDFSFCVFVDCYFKKAFFEQINFTSCIFR